MSPFDVCRQVLFSIKTTKTVCAVVDDSEMLFLMSLQSLFGSVLGRTLIAFKLETMLSIVYQKVIVKGLLKISAETTHKTAESLYGVVTIHLMTLQASVVVKLLATGLRSTARPHKTIMKLLHMFVER